MTAIWDTLEASADFTSAVDEKNRIKVVGGTFSPKKPGLATADLPQVSVLPLGADPKPFNTSSSSRYTSFFSIETLGGTMQFETLADLDWIVYVALMEWQTYIRDAVTWLGESYVKSFRQVEIDHDIVNRRKVRAAQGWQSLWVGKCDMFFTSSTLRA